jgi:predicted DNA-binding transcriptional regulator AlpA
LTVNIHRHSLNASLSQWEGIPEVDDDEVLTIEQIAERLNRPENTIRYWRAIGTGPRTFRLGRRVVAMRSDVDAWLAEQRKQQGGDAA